MTETELDALLAPIPGDKPCGSSMVYDNVFDQIRQAREEDDVNLPQGVWQATLKRANWKEVITLATDVLENHSKDLQIAAWLGEAWIATDGIEGGTWAFRLLQGLCSRYWQDIHPLPQDDDMEYRTTPFDWADAKWALALEQRAPLIWSTGADVRSYTLGDWRAAMETENQARKDKDAMEAAQRAGTPIYSKIIEHLATMPVSALTLGADHVKSMTQALREIQQSLSDLVGAGAPRFGKTEKTLGEVAAVLEQVTPLHPKYEPAMEEEEADAVKAESVTADGRVPTFPINGRDDAYRKLSQLADYLANIEPHSPVPSLIRRAVTWGRMPFDELMRELMQNNGELQRILWRDQK